MINEALIIKDPKSSNVASICLPNLNMGSPEDPSTRRHTKSMNTVHNTVAGHHKKKQV